MNRLLKAISHLAINVFVFLSCSFFPIISLAYDGIGSVADQFANGPLVMVESFMIRACYVMGVVLLIIAFNKYFRYRRNPQETPISTPVLYALFGVIIILLPLAHVLVTKAGLAS